MAEEERAVTPSNLAPLADREERGEGAGQTSAFSANPTAHSANA